MQGERIQVVLNDKLMDKVNYLKEVYCFENYPQTIRHIIRNYKDERLGEELDKLFKELE